MGDVVALRPSIIPAGQSNPDLVVELEKLLERAKQGEVIGAAVALSKADGSISTWWSGGEGATYALVAATAGLAHRLANWAGAE